ncbi:MAG: VCBS repeat-containing protein [Candidatus Latescibacteria bacterium]|nr:VCBS repeat-containing protein [Candidatus Latescibacterota bacterium]
MSSLRVLLAGLLLAWNAAQAAQDWRVLALRVDFPPETPDEATTTGQGAFDLRTRAEALPEYLVPFDTPPHDRAYFERQLRALSRYYQVVSEGQVQIDYAVFPAQDQRAYTLPQPALYYGSGRTREEIGRRWTQLLSEAVALADADPQGPRFAEYNSFLILHAGVGHETGELNDIRSVYLSAEDLKLYLDQPLRADGGETLIPDAWILPEAVSRRGQAGLIGLLAKFFGHQLGLPGLSNFAAGLPATGGWSLMDVGANRLGYVLQGDSLKAVFGFAPPHPEAWSKAQLGWIAPLEVRRDTTVAVVATDRHSGLPKALRIPLAGGEYLLIENRQQRGRRGLPAGVSAPYQDTAAVWLDSSQYQVEEGVWTGVDEYDAFVPGSGILIWHVDERVIGEQRAAGKINDDPLEPGIFLHEADGHRDIGNPIFERIDQIEGSAQDPFYQGGNALFGPAAARSNTGLESGIDIEVLSPPSDTVLVRISFAQTARGWPLRVGAGQRLQGIDADGDGKAELLIQGDEGVQVAKAESGVVWAVPGARLLAAADLDGDGKAEIFAAQGNEVSAWKMGAGAPVWKRQVVGMEPVNGLFVRAPDLLFGRPILALTGLRQLAPDGVEDAVLLNANTGDTVMQLGMGLNGLSMIYADLDDYGPALVFPQANIVLTGGGDTAPTGPLTNEELPGLGQASLPAVAGDLDGDGRAEVVVAWPQGRIAAIGERGWQTELGDSLRAGPVLGDVDGDGLLEIVLVSTEQLQVLRADRTRQADFPATLPRAQRAGVLQLSPILLDLDGDGRQEIFAGTRNGVYGLGEDAQPLAGFPLLTGEGVSAPPLGLDLDGDGELELAALAGEYLHVWDPGTWATPYKGQEAGWAQQGAGAEGTHAYSATRQLPRPDLSAPLLPEGRVYCYPNPVGSGDQAHLRFFLNQPARVELEVFDPLGERMGHLQAQGGLAENELSWPVAGYASGLYLCRLEAKAEDGTKAVVVVKMAVGK